MPQSFTLFGLPNLVVIPAQIQETIYVRKHFLFNNVCRYQFLRLLTIPKRDNQFNGNPVVSTGSDQYRFATGDVWTIFHTSNFFVDIQSFRIPQTIVKFNIQTKQENGLLIYNNHTILICEVNIFNGSNDWNRIDVAFDNRVGDFDWAELFYGNQAENDYMTVIDRFNSVDPKEDLLLMIGRVTYWTAFDVEVRILRKYDYGENEYYWEYIISNELIYLPGQRPDIQASN